jgi:hypothetical protein
VSKLSAQDAADLARGRAIRELEERYAVNCQIMLVRNDIEDGWHAFVSRWHVTFDGGMAVERVYENVASAHAKHLVDAVRGAMR